MSISIFGRFFFSVVEGPYQKYDNDPLVFGEVFKVHLYLSVVINSKFVIAEVVNEFKILKFKAFRVFGVNVRQNLASAADDNCFWVILSDVAFEKGIISSAKRDIVYVLECQLLKIVFKVLYRVRLAFFKLIINDAL